MELRRKSCLTSTHQLAVIFWMAGILAPGAAAIKPPSLYVENEVRVGDQTNLTCYFIPSQSDQNTAPYDYSVSFCRVRVRDSYNINRNDSKDVKDDVYDDMVTLVQIDNISKINIMGRREDDVYNDNGNRLSANYVNQENADSTINFHVTEGKWVFTFTLNEVKAKDYGRYACGITIGTSNKFFSSSKLLNVTGPPDIQRGGLNTTIPGVMAKKHGLVFAYYANPPVDTVTWTLPDGTTVPGQGQSRKPGKNSETFNLVAETQTGLYTCLLNNGIGSDAIAFNVTNAPYVFIPSKYGHVLLTSGLNDEVDCLAGNLNTTDTSMDVKLSWILMTSEGDVISLPDSQSNGSTVTHMVVNDTNGVMLKSTVKFTGSSVWLSGNLTCIGEGSDGRRMTTTVRIRMQGPPRISTALTNKVVSIGDFPLTLTCSVTSYPRASIYKWFRNGYQLIEGMFYQMNVNYTSSVSSTMSLWIKKFDSLDSMDTYACKANNVFGWSKETVQIEVCQNGFEPSTNQDACVDVDECQQANASSSTLCDYQCENTNGSYKCICPDDKKLDWDMKTCVAYRQTGRKDDDSIIVTALLVSVSAVALTLLLTALTFYCLKVRRKKKKEKEILKRVVDNAQRNRSNQMMRFTNTIINNESPKLRPISLPGNQESQELNEFPRERLKVGNVIGQGRFGVVCEAEALNIIGTGRWEVVAVKMCKETASSQEKSDFFRELDVMCRIPKHLNVVNFLGSCSRTEPVTLIMEYVTGGDLQSYLRENRNFLFHDDCLSLNGFSGTGFQSATLGRAGPENITDPEVWTRSIVGMRFEVETDDDALGLLGGDEDDDDEDDEDSGNEEEEEDYDSEDEEESGDNLRDYQEENGHENQVFYLSHEEKSIDQQVGVSGDPILTKTNPVQTLTVDKEIDSDQTRNSSSTKQNDKDIKTLDVSDKSTLKVNKVKEKKKKGRRKKGPKTLASDSSQKGLIFGSNSSSHSEDYHGNLSNYHDSNKNSNNDSIIRNASNQAQINNKLKRNKGRRMSSDGDESTIYKPASQVTMTTDLESSIDGQSSRGSTLKRNYETKNDTSNNNNDNNNNNNNNSNNNNNNHRHNFKRQTSEGAKSTAESSTIFSTDSTVHPRRHRKRAPITADAISVSLSTADRDSTSGGADSSVGGWSRIRYSRYNSRQSSRFSHVTYRSDLMDSDIEEEGLQSKDLFAFGLQVARGMRHLAENHIIHRDLATRNILITDRGVCKIADFGLARALHETDNHYELSSKGPLPIRWMAPEALVDGLHSTKSDVWSFGILLWEIVTLGASPYPGMATKEVFNFVTGGRRMDQPLHCTTELYHLMHNCWCYNPDTRPTFQSICARMEDLLEKEADYINMELFESGQYACLGVGEVDERV